MQFWRRKKTLRVTDPVFGDMVWKDGEWTASLSLPSLSDEPVMVSVEAGEDAPCGKHRQAFQDLIQVVATHAEDVDAQLVALVGEYWEDLRSSDSALGRTLELREQLELSNICLSAEGPPELIFGFKGDIWPDAMLTLVVDGQGIRGISLDD